MRAITVAMVFQVTAFIAIIAGCAGKAPVPQAGKAIDKSKEKIAVKPTAPAAATEESTPPTSHDRENERITVDELGPTESAAPVEQPAVKQGASPIAAQRAPTVRPTVMPEVVLSAAHAEDCLIRVGDVFPEFRLPDLMGRMQSLKDLQGKSLTVVVFWSGDRLLAAEQLRYLNEHITRYADLGVNAIAVNVGQTPESVRKIVEDLKLQVPMLLDLDRSLFARVGKAHLPRTYLLDQDGSVLWLDIEFSRHTRDGLEQAIHASLEST